VSERSQTAVATLRRAAAALVMVGPTVIAQAPPGAEPRTPPAGRVEELRIDSAVYGRARRVWVYTPPGYSQTAFTAYDLLVAFDGAEYLDEMRLPAMLDALLAERRAGPFVAVLIDNASSAERLADLANHARFSDFLAGELVNWVRGRWRVTRDPRRTIVTGSSAGGLAAAHAALRHPEVFGNVLSQSGAFWRGNEGSNQAPFEWLTSQYAASPRRDIRFVLEVGALESAGAMGGAAPSILEANRRLRDVLAARGYPVTYAEVPAAGHGPEFWRLRLPDALATLARFDHK
jgi:enterochelin esterase family protein